MKFRGVVPVIVLPLNEDESIDEFASFPEVYKA